MDTCSYSTEPTPGYMGKFPLQRQDNSRKGNWLQLGWLHEKPLSKAATDSSTSVTACQQRQFRLTTTEQLMNGFFCGCGVVSADGNWYRVARALGRPLLMGLLSENYVALNKTFKNWCHTWRRAPSWIL